MHLCSPCDKNRRNQGGATLGSYKGQPLERASIGSMLPLQKECYIAREPLHQWGEFKSAISTHVNALPGITQEPVRSNFASVCVEIWDRTHRTAHQALLRGAQQE